MYFFDFGPEPSPPFWTFSTNYGIFHFEPSPNLFYGTPGIFEFDIYHLKCSGTFSDILECIRSQRVLVKVVLNVQGIQGKGLLTENFQDFGRSPAYLQRMRAEAAEEARRWEEEQEAEVRRKEAMKLSAEEKETILQVRFFKGK